MTPAWDTTLLGWGGKQRASHVLLLLPLLSGAQLDQQPGTEPLPKQDPGQRCHIRVCRVQMVGMAGWLQLDIHLALALPCLRGHACGMQRQWLGCGRRATGEPRAEVDTSRSLPFPMTWPARQGNNPLWGQTHPELSPVALSLGRTSIALQGSTIKRVHRRALARRAWPFPRPQFCQNSIGGSFS